MKHQVRPDTTIQAFAYGVITTLLFLLASHACLQAKGLAQKDAQKKRPSTKHQSNASSRGKQKMIQEKATGGQIVFPLATKQIIVTTHDLDQMRQSIVIYLQHHEEEQEHADLSVELKQAKCFIVDNRTGYVGNWRLEQRNEHFQLTRYPAERTPVTILYHALLVPQEGHWKTNALNVERIRAR